MNIVFAILLGYAILFFLLSREGFDVGDTIHGLAELIPLLFLGVVLVNFLFGTDFDENTVFHVWFGLVGLWTLVAIWFLIDEPRKRRLQDERLKRLLSGEEP